MQRVLPVIFICFAVVIGGCSPEEKPTPTVLAATFAAAKDVNPNASGRPSPIVVRYYQLRALKSFENATFFDIYEQGEATLGVDLVKWNELELSPGDEKPISLSLEPDTEYVGFVVAYRAIEDAKWRAHVATPRDVTTTAIVQVDKLAVTLR